MEQRVYEYSEEGIFGRWYHEYEIRIEGFWPELRSLVRCPVCGNEMLLADIVPELNDDHEWSREQIADWLDKL